MSVSARESALLCEAARLVTGWYEFSMDPKGRLVLPCEWRYAVGVPFALVPAPRGRLYGVRAEDWLELVQMHHYRDYYLSGSAIISELCGSTGRFQIPHFLREHAGLLPGSVTLAGLGVAFQVAPTARWKDAKTACELRIEYGSLLALEASPC